MIAFKAETALATLVNKNNTSLENILPYNKLKVSKIDGN
jgi:hypothetical protein